MTPATYRKLRALLGSREKVARILEITTTTIRNRETDMYHVKQEAGFALRFALLLEEQNGGTPERISVSYKPRKRK